MATNPIDLTGKKFGRWTVEARAGMTRYGRAQWRCRCECGTVRLKNGASVRNGHSLSCGCLGAEKASGKSTHGLSKTGMYRQWQSMIARCHRPSNTNYPHYGARGITVCDRWRFGENGKTAVECFIDDMGPRPSPGHSVDRENNDGNYEPDNCRWATRTEQGRNTRANHRVEVRGESLCLAELAERYSLSVATIQERIRKGETGEQLIRKPKSKEQIAARHAAMVEHYKVWRSLTSVAHAFDVSTSTAHKVISTLAPEIMSPPRSKKAADAARRQGGFAA